MGIRGDWENPSRAGYDVAEGSLHGDWETLGPARQCHRLVGYSKRRQMRKRGRLTTQVAVGRHSSWCNGLLCLIRVGYALVLLICVNVVGILQWGRVALSTLTSERS